MTSIESADRVTLAEVEAAAARIADLVHRTPVVRSRSLEAGGGQELHLKCEQLQRTGSFKLRGALNAMMVRSADVSPHGVVTMSSGNFAQGLAWAARAQGVPAHAVMPSTAVAVKRRAAEDFGAFTYLHDPELGNGPSIVEEVRARTGATFISSHDDPDVIAGHATLALELLDQLGEVDAIVGSIGGGGLISGIAIVARALRHDLTVIGVEPSRAADAHRSKQVGERVDVDFQPTIADGLVARLGRTTWPYVRDLVDDVVTVDEEEIVQAMRLLWSRAKLVVEPSAAAALAGALQPSFRARPLRRVAVVLSGGNVDLDALPWGSSTFAGGGTAGRG